MFSFSLIFRGRITLNRTIKPEKMISIHLEHNMSHMDSVPTSQAQGDTFSSLNKNIYDARRFSTNVFNQQSNAYVIDHVFYIDE
jgi:hypothetical protein